VDRAPEHPAIDEPLAEIGKLVRAEPREREQLATRPHEQPVRVGRLDAEALRAPFLDLLDPADANELA
jgi:hypothetical protein